MLMRLNLVCSCITALGLVQDVSLTEKIKKIDA